MLALSILAPCPNRLSRANKSACIFNIIGNDRMLFATSKNEFQNQLSGNI
jgi:hypothetical protein